MNMVIVSELPSCTPQSLSICNQHVPKHGAERDISSLPAAQLLLISRSLVKATHASRSLTQARHEEACDAQGLLVCHPQLIFDPGWP